jgi:uncharacterized membrane protein
LLALLPRMNVAKGWLFVVPGGSRALKHVIAILFGNKLHLFESVRLELSKKKVVFTVLPSVKVKVDIRVREKESTWSDIS